MAIENQRSDANVYDVFSESRDNKIVSLGDVRVLESQNPELTKRLYCLADGQNFRFFSDKFHAALKQARTGVFTLLEQFLHEIETEGFIAKIEENTITPEEEEKFIEHLKCCADCKRLLINHTKITQFIRKEGYNFLNEEDKKIRDVAKYIVKNYMLKEEEKKSEFPLY